jgi:hypothetical protein
LKELTMCGLWSRGARFSVVLVSILLVLAVASGCGKKEELKVDPKGATKVEVFRIDGEGEHVPPAKLKAGEKTIGGYLVMGQGPDQGPAFADRLAEVLNDPGTYTKNYAKCFWPGVAFRVWKDGECEEVLICFMCDNLYRGPPKDFVMENASFNGSPRRRDLLRLAKEALPDDAAIQAIKDK